MTGFEPLITAATAGLTTLVTDIIKGQGSNMLTRLLSQDLGKGMQQAYFDASKKYIQNYAERHGSLKVLGMREPLSLDSIYTTVQILDTDGDSFASVEDLEQAFRKAQERRLRFGENSRKEGLTIANEKQYLMVLGAPGCGKSTFLRKIGLEALKGNLSASKKYHCIPIFLELKRLTEAKVDIKKLIMREFQVCGFPNAEPFTQKALEQGKLLILLDGLDEVPAANRDIVIESIQDFVDQYDKNRFITSCRIAAYRHNFRRFTDVTIADFDNDQIKQFIHNWFKSEADQQSGTAKRCWEILQRRENSAAKELAHTPLLLTFLCLVFDRSQTFSNNRSTLYRKALRILLEEWAAEKRIFHQEVYQGLNIELEEVLLSEIAATSFNADRLFLSKVELVDLIKTFLASNLNAPKHLSGETVLNAIAVQQGILVERAEDVYSFSHLTLQEYLTAQYVVDHYRIKPLVTEHLSNHRWREVFLLVSGSMVTGSGADELLQAINQAIQTNAAQIPKLQALLQWTYQMAAPASDSKSGATKRAVVLAFAIECAHDRSFKRNYSPSNYNKTFEEALQLYTARNLDTGRVLVELLDPNLILDLDRACDIGQTLDITHVPVIVRNISRDFHRIRVAASDLNSFPLFVGVDFALLIDHLTAMIQYSVPELNDAIENHSKFVDRLQQIFMDIFKLDSTLLNWTAEEKTAIASYLYMNQLMVKCQQEASRVSPEVWESVLATMLVPAARLET